MAIQRHFNIQYLPPGTIPLADLTYVIIGTREHDKWIFVRHRERKTWELPAGHIEKGESTDEAAHRELFEETGVREAELKVIHDYVVEDEKQSRAGRIYLAISIRREALPESEIAEIRIQSESPTPATYPEAHHSFLEVLNRAIGQN